MGLDEHIENMKAVKRGGEGLGIGEQFPVSEYGTPTFTDGQSATHEEMVEAGFHEADDDEDGPKLIDQNGNVIDFNSLRFSVLRDEDGNIVATWDEGRWWSLKESKAFLATMLNPALRMMAEATHAIETQNRAQRRKKKKGQG